MKYASSRLDPVKPSAAAWVSQAARALKQQGQDVIDMGLGEPDFDTPPHIVEAAYTAAKAGETRYPPNDGTVAMKTAVIEKFARDNQLTFAADQILVSNGAKQVIFNALMASLEAHHEVVLCAPYFGLYKDMVTILGGTPVELPCLEENAFLTSPASLDAVITDNTRWIILNSPSNPTGAVYDADQLRALGEVLAKHPQVLIMADEIYEHIVFDDRPFVSFASACPELRDRTLVVNGVSKAYAMTGWRIGYGAGPQALISAMNKVQSQISSGACSVAQAAAAVALSGPQDSVQEFRKAFERRRDLIVSLVEKIDGLTLDPPRGAFYAFIGCVAFIGAIRPDGKLISNDADLTQYLLEHALVAAVPGSAYGLSPFFRLSTATDEQTITSAMNRVATSLAALTLPNS